MNVYLSSPQNQLQANAVREMPVLLSFALYKPWMDRYQQSFGRILIDSGAYSELTGNARVDIGEYRDWAEPWRGKVDAIAGLDDIGGDWRRSLKNYKAIPWAFPTFHDTDPPELLDDLLAIAKERGKWIGVGLKPPRAGKDRFVRATLDRIPEGFHVHGWALRLYTHLARIDSTDSTNWMLDAMKISRDLPWLTYGEALEIVVKRYKRWQRVIEPDQPKEVGILDALRDAVGEGK